MIKIINEYCEKGIPLLEDYSIDLVVTSPPYNVDLGNNKYHKSSYDIYNDNKDHHKYILWLKNIFAIIYKKLVLGGRVCINVGDGGNGSVPTSSDIIQFMKELRYIPLTHIIWDKSQTSNRAAWGSYKSPSCPSFPTPFEHIMVFAKTNKKLQRNGKTDLSEDEFVSWTIALWKFPPELRQDEFGHKAMFPEELPKRCIKMFSYVDSLILDPFNGAGTTAVVCKKLNRNYIGFEISKAYCTITEKRLNTLEELINDNKKQKTIEDAWS